MNFSDAMDELQSSSNPKSKRDYQNHGANDNIFGVSVTDLRRLSIKIGCDHALSRELYNSGNFDAMHLSAMIADPSLLTKDDLDEMVSKAYCHVLSDYVVAALATEQKAQDAMTLANKWISSETEMIKSAGWSTYAMLICIHKDSDLSKSEIHNHLCFIRDNIANASDHIKNSMIKFVVSVGTAYLPLREEAFAIAKQIGRIKVSLSAASAKIWNPSSDIQKVIDKGSLGKKRKGFR